MVSSFIARARLQRAEGCPHGSAKAFSSSAKSLRQVSGPSRHRVEEHDLLGHPASAPLEYVQVCGVASRKASSGD